MYVVNLEKLINDNAIQAVDIETLREKLADVEKANKILTQNNTDVFESNQQLRHENSNLRAQLEATERRNAELREQLAIANTTIMVLQQGSSIPHPAIAENKELQNNINRLTIAFNSSQELLRTKSNEIHNLKEKIKHQTWDLEKLFPEHTKLVKSLKTQIQGLEGRLKEYQEKVVKLEKKVLTQQDDLRTAIYNRDCALRLNAFYSKEKFEEVQHDLNKRNVEFYNLEAQVKSLQERSNLYDIALQELEFLKKELLHARGVVNHNLKMQIRGLEAKLKKYYGKPGNEFLPEFEERLATLRKANKELYKQRETYRQQIEELEKQMVRAEEGFRTIMDSNYELVVNNVNLTKKVENFKEAYLGEIESVRRIFLTMQKGQEQNSKLIDELNELRAKVKSYEEGIVRLEKLLEPFQLMNNLFTGEKIIGG